MKDQHWTDRSLKSVWHPCTQMKAHEESPLLAIKNGRGVYLYDYEGKSYLDSISSWWTNLFGHANPFINQAIINQLGEVEHVMLAGMTHRPVVELSERLSALTGHHLGRAFYGSDGASAVEISLKMSFHYWRNLGFTSKSKFVCLQNSYHGETLGALGVTDIPLFSDTYSPLIQPPILCKSPVPFIDSVSLEVASQLAIEDLRATFEAHHQQIACFILEPMIQCAAGMQMYSAEYLKAARALCSQYEVLMIADEIAVGFGRTGKFFACEHAGIWPDLMTLSKGLTGGYLPLSVVLSTETIYQAFYKDDVRLGFLHSHSYTGNPLACTAALATLDLFDQSKGLELVNHLAAQLFNTFKWVKEDTRLSNLRQLGSILAFDVTVNQLPLNFSKKFDILAKNLGLLIRPIGNSIYVMPPYIISESEIEFLSQTIQICLNEILGDVS
jgi:adenosylmethionine-8-amino-7-oxononanoate aminotransferase